MYKVVEIDPLGESRWDKFVINHPFGWITHLSLWKTIIENSFKHIKGYYFAVIDQNDESIHAALPFYEVKSWLTGNRLVSIPFATISDPLISSKKQLKLLLDSAFDLSQKIKIPNIGITTFNTNHLSQDSRFASKQRFKLACLPLDPNLESVKKRFHKTSIKQKINKALKSGLKLKIGESKSDLKRFYHLYIQSRKRLHLPPQPFDYIENLWETLYPLHMIELLMAEKNGELIAAVINFKYKDRVSGEFEAWNKNYRKLCPTHFLIWESIKRAYRDGYKIVDMGRTANSNKGLMKFKKRWGTNMVDLIDLQYPKSKSEKGISVEDSFKFKAVNNICKITPVRLQPLLGRICYRHIG